MIFFKLILQKLLGRLGFSAMSASGIYFLAGLALFISIGSFWAGVEFAGRWHKAEQLEALQEALAERDAAQKKLSAIDHEVVVLTRDLREKHRELQDALAKSFDADRCRVYDDGMQRLTDKIRTANARRGFAGADGGDP
ncbi:MAG: hypothetical protein ABW066_06740 [Sedimenticola sp.]